MNSLHKKYGANAPAHLKNIMEQQIGTLKNNRFKVVKKFNPEYNDSNWNYIVDTKTNKECPVPLYALQDVIEVLNVLFE